MLPFSGSDNFSLKSMKNRVQFNNAFNNRLGNSSQLNTTEYQINNSKYMYENKYGIPITEKSINIQNKVQEKLLVLYQPSALIVCFNIFLICVLVADFILIFTRYNGEIHNYAYIFIINTASSIPYHLFGLLATLGSYPSVSRYLYCLHLYAVFVGIIFIFLRILIPLLVVNLKNVDISNTNNLYGIIIYSYPVDAMVIGIFFGCAIIFFAILTRILTTHYVEVSPQVLETGIKPTPNRTGNIRTILPSIINT